MRACGCEMPVFFLATIHLSTIIMISIGIKAIKFRHSLGPHSTTTYLNISSKRLTRATNSLIPSDPSLFGRIAVQHLRSDALLFHSVLVIAEKDE